MATANPFELLGDDDAEDPSLLIAAQQQKIEPNKAAAPSPKMAAGGAKAAAHTEAQAKLPSKPLPPQLSLQFQQHPKKCQTLHGSFFSSFFWPCRLRYGCAGGCCPDFVAARLGEEVFTGGCTTWRGRLHDFVLGGAAALVGAALGSIIHLASVNC